MPSRRPSSCTRPAWSSSARGGQGLGVGAARGESLPGAPWRLRVGALGWSPPCARHRCPRGGRQLRRAGGAHAAARGEKGQHNRLRVEDGAAASAGGEAGGGGGAGAAQGGHGTSWPSGDQPWGWGWLCRGSSPGVPGGSLVISPQIDWGDFTLEPAGVTDGAAGDGGARSEEIDWGITVEPDPQVRGPWLGLTLPQPGPGGVSGTPTSQGALCFAAG